MTRTIGAYKSYNFRDKDPVIDIVRRIVELYAAEHDIKFTVAMHKIAIASGVSYACMNQWFYGTTCRPQFATVQAVVRACGSNFTISAKPRVVHGAKHAA